MSELLTSDALALLLVSFSIGIVIGLTGMGGGALMTPALIFFGIPPAAAVANDLVAAAVNKTSGALVHLREGSPHRGVAIWLMLGSVPTAAAGAFIVDALGSGEAKNSFVKTAIGVTLLVAAATYAYRVYMELRGDLRRDKDAHPPVRKLPTVAIGVVGGLLVGITSVGSGTVMMVALLVLYPTLSGVRLVGTDLLQAIPLVLSAAISHIVVTGVDLEILVPLILGGTPGTFLGARLANRVSQSVVRRGIVIVLVLTGISMLGAGPFLVFAVGIFSLVAGPLVWGWLRTRHGLPPFDRLPFGSGDRTNG